MVLRRVAALVFTASAQAVAAASSNRLRTSLAALATAAAVATIVLVVSGLDGIERYARDAGARSFGSNTFVIAQLATGQLSRREIAERLARNPAIRRSDLRFLERVADGRVLYAPTAQRGADVVAGNRTFENAAVNGTSATLPSIRVIEIADGRFFTATEEVRAAPVVVLGADIADTLFPGVSAVGRRVRLAGRAFDVVGVVVREGQAGGVSLDRYCYLPIGAYERAFGAAPSLQLFATAPPDVLPVTAEDRAQISMRARRQLAPGAPDTFDIITPEAARAFVLRLATRIGAAAMPISLMALLTAIVVVTNTVLVSVTQRMREIGVRRAVGASRAQILLEVLAESLLTAVLGGAAGLIVALGLLSIVGGLLGFPLDTSRVTMFGALAAAAATGLIAGYFPARKAARIDVIAALRLE